MSSNFKFYFILIAICLSNSITYSQAKFIPGKQKIDLSLLKMTHPRVLVADFEPIKENLKTEPIMQTWLAQLREEKNMDALALDYKLTGEKVFLDKAFETASTLDLEEKIKKGPHHYGRFICYLGCTYDWLYDDLSLDQRNQLLKLIKRGLEAYLVDPDKTNFHNMNHCLNSGAIVAAIAIADEEPVLAKRVLEVAINTINLTWYKPDGVTPEGPHYMNWSSLLMFSGLSTLDVAFNKSFGLTDEPGLMGYGDFMMNITIPKKGIAVKYSDCYTNGTYYNLGQIFWIANKFNRSDLAQFALENDKYTASGENPDYSGKIHQLLWYNPKKFKIDAKTHQTLPLDKQFKSAELAVMRNSWDDVNTIFAGLKGTDDYHQANFYHRHTNTGTFFLSALGQQWAVDLGLEDYNLPDYNVQPRLYYKLRAEGHNCNIINPASGIDNRGWENCPIIAHGNSLQESFAIVDMTPDYDKLAKNAKRGLKLYDNRRKVLLQDEISSLDGKPLDSYWFMQTEAAIEIAPDGRSAMLYRANEKMLVYMATAPKDARFTVMGTEPLIYTKPVNGKQDWTFGAKKLTIHTSTEKDLKLAVVFVPIQKGEKVTTEKLVYHDLATWSVSLLKEATLSEIQIDKNLIPNFDSRVFTYTVDIKSNFFPKVSAISRLKNANVTVRKEQNNPNKVTITVSSPDFKTSSYVIYFRENPVSIYQSASHEYSSWDESFANHRIVAPVVNGGKFLEYELNDVDSIGAMTIGFNKQSSKPYKFEIWGSIDQKNWDLKYQGVSNKVAGIKMAMPQLFDFKSFDAKYIRIKNPDSTNTFSYEILNFYKDKAMANDYLNHTYKEVLMDVVFLQKNIQLKKGDKIQFKMDGLSNYGKKINLSEAKNIFESEDQNVFSVLPSGEITANTIGTSFLRIMVQKDDYVFHKKIEVKVID
jgi:hypothetical protein